MVRAGPSRHGASQAGPQPADLVELGVLRGPYGLRGWSHLQPHSADPGVLRAVKRWWLAPPEQHPANGTGLAVMVTGVRAQGSGLVAKWQGCDDPDAALARKGWRVLVAREDFPPAGEGQYYWVDLIGARVVNREGRELGRVQALRSTGAHDLLEVRDEAAPEGAPRLIPMVGEYVDAVDVAGRCLRVDWQPDW